MSGIDHLIAGPVDSHGTPIRLGDWFTLTGLHLSLVVRVEMIQNTRDGWFCIGGGNQHGREVRFRRRCDEITVAIRSYDDRDDDWTEAILPGLVEDLIAGAS